MLIVAVVLAVIGLAALISAVVTSNELLAWICIGVSGLGVLTLIVDAIRERTRRPVPTPAVAATPAAVESTEVIEPVASPPDESDSATVVFTGDAAIAVEDYPDELVHDEPDYDMPSDDEAEFPEPAEEAALHIVSDDEVEYADAIEDDLVETPVVETAPTGDEMEIRYVTSAEGSADIVYTHSESSGHTPAADS